MRKNFPIELISDKIPISYAGSFNGKKIFPLTNPFITLRDRLMVGQQTLDLFI